MELVPRAASCPAKQAWLLINECAEYIILHEFVQSNRNIHLYWELSQKLKEMGIHQTPSKFQECMKHLKPKAKASETWSGEGFLFRSLL